MPPIDLPEPRTLAAASVEPDPTVRARLAVLYLARLDRHRADALAVRDAALREAPVNAPTLADLVGVSHATVKLARRSPRR